MEKTPDQESDKRLDKLQVLLAEMREVKNSKTALAIFYLLETGWSEETLLRTKVTILMLAELERIREALEDPYHVKRDLKQEEEGMKQK